MSTDLLLVALGAALLYAGGEALVHGAVHLARRVGLSPLVIGCTVVAFATSSPELAATLAATLAGADAVAVGNVMGSNIANVGLILGLAALLRPLTAQRRFLRREVPWMLAASLVLLPLLRDGRISHTEGAFLFALLVIFVLVLLRGYGAASAVEEAGARRRATLPLPASSALVVGGVVLLVGGAEALVDGALAIARVLAVPERIIGLTLVAIGTSLPELASSLVAARRQESDIVLGNVVGSNLFNLLCVLGLTAMVRPVTVPPEALRVDVWVMLAFSAVTVPLLAPRLHLGRLGGAFLVGAYILYLVLLVAS